MDDDDDATYGETTEDGGGSDQGIDPAHFGPPAWHYMFSLAAYIDRTCSSNETHRRFQRWVRHLVTKLLPCSECRESSLDFVCMERRQQQPQQTVVNVDIPELDMRALRLRYPAHACLAHVFWLRTQVNRKLFAQRLQTIDDDELADAISPAQAAERRRAVRRQWCDYAPRFSQLLQQQQQQHDSSCAAGQHPLSRPALLSLARLIWWMAHSNRTRRCLCAWTDELADLLEAAAAAQRQQQQQDECRDKMQRLVASLRTMWSLSSLSGGGNNNHYPPRVDKMGDFTRNLCRHWSRACVITTQHQ